MPAASPSVHFSGLNALRFFAAFAIIIYHSTLDTQAQSAKAVKMFLHNLPLGVDLFFIISGFLITYLLLLEKQKTNTISLSKFYVRRVLRIFPLYFLIVLIAYLVYRNSNPEIYFSKFLYFAGNFWMIATNQWTVAILNPLWSLCIEEHFYLCIPFLIMVIPIKRIPHLFWSIILISLFYRIYAVSTIEYSWMAIYLHTLSRCDLLAVGGLVACAHLQKPIEIKVNNTIFWAIVGYLMLLMAILDANDYSTTFFALFKKYLFALPLLAIFLMMVFGGNVETTASGKNNLLNWFKSNKTINYFGKISYGLYMYHIPVSELVIRINCFKGYPDLKFIPVTLLTIIVAALSYELFEKQILKLKTRFETIKTRNV